MTYRCSAKSAIVSTRDTTSVPSAAPGASSGCGATRRRTASRPTYSAEPVTISACTSPATPSDLPWPKRCSRSAGVSAKRTASNVMTDAARSSSESASEPSNATEPLAAYAHAFMMISTSATVTDAPPARRIKRPRSPDSAACMALDVAEPRRGGAQRLLLLRETEAHERRSGRRLGAEHRDRDRGDAVLRGEAARELGIGLGRDSPVV